MKLEGKIALVTDAVSKAGLIEPDYWTRFVLGEKLQPIKSLVPDADLWVKKAYRSFYLRPRKIFQQMLRIRSFDDLKKNIDAFFGILSFKMREDAFTVIRKRTFDDRMKQGGNMIYSSSPLLEIENLKDNLESFEEDLNKENPTNSLPKI